MGSPCQRNDNSQMKPTTQPTTQPIAFNTAEAYLSCMDILILVQSDMAKPDHGYAIRAHHWMKRLVAQMAEQSTKKHKLHVLHVGFKDRPDTPDAQLASYASFSPSKVSGAGSALWGRAFCKPLQVCFLSPTRDLVAYAKALPVMDAVICVGVRPAMVLEHIEHKQLWVDFIDSVPEMYRSGMQGLNRGWQTLFYSLEHKPLQRWDNRLARQANRSFFVSPDHVIQQKKRTPEANIALLPNGPGAILSPPSNEAAFDRMYFLGPLDYRPNRDALLWFLTHVYEAIEHPPELLVIGRHAPDSLRYRLQSHPQITQVDYAENLDVALKNYGVCIAPMISGGGQQNKVTEALCSGRQVMVTSVVAAGIDGFKAGHHGQVLNGQPAWSEALHGWADQRPLRLTQASQASELKAILSWDRMDHAIEALLATKAI